MIEETFSIAGEKIEAGENRMIKLHIANLPSQTRIFVQVHIFRAEKPGPCMLVLGGMHGDEINGVEIVRRTLAEGQYDNLTAGTVIAVPLLNVYGFINFSRELPDGKDVNRSFPGWKSGSLASRIAYTMSREVLPHVDFGIDFHTGGRTLYNHPQVRYTKADETGRELAEYFGAPYILEKRPIAKSLRKTAYKKEKTIIVFEGGESQRWSGEAIDYGTRGIERILRYTGMVKGRSVRRTQSIHFEKSTWMRASRAGLFLWEKRAGEVVKKNDVLGRIHDPYGNRVYRIRSRKNGYILSHNNAAVVSRGDALFRIGYFPDAN